MLFSTSTASTTSTVLSNRRDNKDFKWLAWGNNCHDRFEPGISFLSAQSLNHSAKTTLHSCSDSPQGHTSLHTEASYCMSPLRSWRRCRTAIPCCRHEWSSWARRSTQCPCPSPSCGKSSDDRRACPWPARLSTCSGPRTWGRCRSHRPQWRPLWRWTSKLVGHCPIFQPESSKIKTNHFIRMIAVTFFNHNFVVLYGLNVLCRHFIRVLYMYALFFCKDRSDRTGCSFLKGVYMGYFYLSCRESNKLLFLHQQVQNTTINKFTRWGTFEHISQLL